jgi:hypothetical protein
VYSAVVKSEVMEGLACPRGAALSPPERKTPAASLPQVEGLASRFDSFFEKVSGVGLAGSENDGVAYSFQRGVLKF